MKIAIKNTAHIGNTIKLTRLSQGLDQLAAAGLAGTGQSFLSHLENGKDTAQIGKALEVLISLGIRIELTVPDDVVDYIEEHLQAEQHTTRNQLQNFTLNMTDEWIPPRTSSMPVGKKYITDISTNATDADTLFVKLTPLFTKRATR